MMRSNIQRHILKLYRELLRAAGGRTGIKEHIQLVFRENAKVKRTNYMQIEYMTRKGARSLQELKHTNSSIVRIKNIR